MKQVIIFFTACILLVFVGAHCAPPAHMYVKQGVRGYARELKGNQMPSPGVPRQKGRGFPATICIFTVVNLNQVEPDAKACFFRAVRARLVKTIQADSTGFFETDLDTGRYSLFLKIGDLYYASLTDQFNHLAPVTVEASRESYIDLVYKSGATY